MVLPLRQQIGCGDTDGIAVGAFEVVAAGSSLLAAVQRAYLHLIRRLWVPRISIGKATVHY